MPAQTAAIATLTQLRPYGQDWLEQVFHCQAARTGGVIRRQIVDVEREVGIVAFVSEVRRRRFRLIRTPQHIVIACDAGQIEILC